MTDRIDNGAPTQIVDAAGNAADVVQQGTLRYLAVADVIQLATRALKRVAGVLTTTATTANQAITIGVEGGSAGANYTVTAGKTLIVPAINVNLRNSAALGGSNGTVQMGIGGVFADLVTLACGNAGNDRQDVNFADDLRLPAGTVLAFRVTPGTANSSVWSIAIPGAYEI